MSLRRINYIVLSGVLPFNFGTDHEGWKKLWGRPQLRDLVGSDPNMWSQDVIDKVNKRARDERELFFRLMGLSDEEFYKEVDRLVKVG